MLGERQCAEESLQAICDTSRRFVTANLEGKLLNVFDDMPEGYIEDNAAIKVLTGGTPHIRVERKNEDPYYARNFCRHVYACNQLPRCSDKGSAWYNRITIFPFENVLSEDEKEEGLREWFATDKELHRAMLAKAVRGLQRLREDDWQLEGSREALEEYKAKNDSIMAFIQDCCDVGPGQDVKRTTFRKAYEQWCDRTGAYRVPTAKDIYDRVRREESFAEKTVRGSKYFSGLGLTEGVER